MTKRYKVSRRPAFHVDLERRLAVKRPEQEFGLRAIRHTAVTGGQSVQTLGGDIVLLVEEDGQQRVRLSEEDSLRIQTLLNVVQQTRQSLDEQVRLISEKRL